MAALGVDADVRFLRYPDYHLPEVPSGILAGEIDAVARETQPQLVVTFGADSLTGHSDHIAVGAATDAAVHRARADEGIVARLLHVGIPGSASPGSRASSARPATRRRRTGASSLSEAFRTRSSRSRWTRGPCERRSWPASRPTARRSASSSDFPEALRWIVLDTESFVQAWPERPASPAAPATSLLGWRPDA